MDKLPVGQLPDLQQSNNDDEIMVITNSEYNQLKKEKISDLITDFTSTNENNALTKGTDGKMFVTDFGNASNITEGTLPVSVLPEIPLEKIPDIPKDKLPPIETADLPVSGVSADTYAYPSSVTVNAQGMVTAIEEGTPSGSNANVDLSNITDAGKEVIKENSGSSGLEVGDPIITLSNTLGENEIWLEGAEVSKTTYSALYAVYGDTYGTAESEDNFVLPDFRGRVLWGAGSDDNFGYIEAGLPNITGTIQANCSSVTLGAYGAFQGSTMEGSTRPASSSGAGDWLINFSAANSNPIYGNSTTVQPPSVKVRVKTRFA